MRFTAANAQQMAAKGHEGRRERKRLRELAEKTGEQPTNSSSVNSDGYVVKQLFRTRKQIEMLNRQLESAPDHRAVKSIADALARLTEIERILAGRPLPGSHRPKTVRSRSTSIPQEPTEAPVSTPPIVSTYGPENG